MEHISTYPDQPKGPQSIPGTQEKPTTGLHTQKIITRDSDARSYVVSPVGNSAALPLWSRPAMRSVADGIFRPGGLTLTDRIAELAGVIPGWQIADIGCGQGASVLRLRQRYGANAVGMDASFAQVSAGTKTMPQHASLPLVMGNAAFPPFRSGVFNMVLCECVLSLLPDTRAALRSFCNLLAPGGILAVTDLYLRNGYNGHTANMALSSNSCLGWGATRKDIAEHLHASGFVLRRFEDHSKLLGELAAKLVFAGESPCLLSPSTNGPAAPCAAKTTHGDTRNAAQLHGSPYGCITETSTHPRNMHGTSHNSQPGKTAAPGYFLLLADRVG